MSSSAATSRLIVSNLPPTITKLELSVHLNQLSVSTTDVQLIKTKRGQTRRIGFIGFNSAEDATLALAYLNNSFLNSNQSGSKIKANYAQPIQSQYNKPQSELDPVDRGAFTSVAVDERLTEFLAVMNNNKNLDHQILPTPTPTTATTLINHQPNPSGAVDGEVEDLVDSFDSDGDYLAARRANQTGDKPIDQHQPANQAEAEASDRLFVRNLTYSVTQAELEQVFSPFGTIQLNLPLDYSTSQPKGFCYVQYSDMEAAIKAKTELDGTHFKGRLLHIIFANTRNISAGSDDQVSRLKDANLAKLKAEGNGLNWATMYLNPDGVIESVANRLNLTKAELLSHETGTSSAVKLALAETHLINETIQYFTSQGVNTDSFEFTTKRDRTTLLVKNLPFQTSIQTLEGLFSGFSDRECRIVVPPSGTIAIVDLLDKEAETKAFKALAYKQLGKNLIYLEKAPQGIWNQANQTRTPTSAPATAATATATTGPGPGPSGRSSISSSAGSTLFVKNLSFNTTNDSLKSAFSMFGGFSFARIQTKPNPHQAGASLSMGFGFVGFDQPESAKQALTARQSFVLDGHSLQIQFAQRGTEDDSTNSSATTKRVAEGHGSKLIVKNLPFEVTREEVRSLFGSYGNLKSVRLPKKVDRQTRGFAFIEFGSSREALVAFNALQHTHLLGRHLVLQWANQLDNDIDKLRKKSKLSTNKTSHIKSKFTLDKHDQQTPRPDADSD